MAFTFRKSFTLGRRPRGDSDTEMNSDSARRFEWKWGNPSAEPGSDSQPATYYEALTGRPDPMRDFFVTARRALNLVVTIIAIGIPIGLVSLGIITGADLQTIVVMGIAGMVVGLMIKTSFPRTPFG
jgi:hypothetical protein